MKRALRALRCTARPPPLIAAPSPSQTTLVELLQALASDAAVALAVVCGSRDALDSVVAALARSSFALAVLVRCDSCAASHH